MQRRIFIRQSVAMTAGLGILGFGCNSGTQSNTTEQAADSTAQAGTAQSPIFKISLAEWSYHKALMNQDIFKLGWQEVGNRFKNDYQSLLKGAQMKHMDFPKKARELGVDGVEYVNQFFYDKAKDTQYLSELKNVCEGEGITSVLIMCDLEGELGNPNEKERMQAVENHYKWVDAAKFLGCHSIRVNAQSQGSFEEQQKLAVDGLSRLGEYAGKAGINILVENHGGLSSNGEWLSGVMKSVNMDHVGTLPDFGNFCIERGMPSAENPMPECKEEYDRYKGVTELMPFAKGVSAKTHDFNEQGQEVHTDYEKMMKIVLDQGYRGFVGIEYEGSNLSEEEGVKATRDLLEKVRQDLTAQYS